MKIGLGLITCNRPDFYAESLKSIATVRSQFESFVVVNDGDELPLPSDIDGIGSYIYKHNKSNSGVGLSKNTALQVLLADGCTDIFLIEDDILISSDRVFSTYIDTARNTGLSHLMFGYHGPANKKNNSPNPRLVVEYPNDIKVALNFHCVGAFTYYQREILEKVGLNDETFINAWEHVEHSLRIVKADGCPAYWWWPDVANSCELLQEQACSEDNSSIRPRPDWQTNIQNGMKHFFNKHGAYPTTVPNISEQMVRERLKTIYGNRSNR